MAIKHAKTSAKADGSDSTLVRPSDWNADHTSQSALEFVIDGGGSTITTGVKGDIECPFAGTIKRVTLVADQTGSIVVDLWKTTYANYDAGATHPVDADSITSATPPTITTSTKSQNSTLSGWTKTFSDGDVIRFNVDSCTAITRVTVSIVVTEP